MPPLGPSRLWFLAVRLAGPAPDTSFLPDFVATFRDDEAAARQAFGTLTHRRGPGREVLRVELRSTRGGSKDFALEAVWPAGGASQLQEYRGAKHAAKIADQPPKPFGSLMSRPVPTLGELDL